MTVEVLVREPEDVRKEIRRCEELLESVGAPTPSWMIEQLVGRIRALEWVLGEGDEGTWPTTR